MKTQLLCTFTTKEELQNTLQQIREIYHIVYNYIYVLQNLKDIDKTRAREDNTKIISTIFFFEKLDKNSELANSVTIKIISGGLKLISKMISHKDKALRKILTTLRICVDDYIKNKGIIGSKLKENFPNYIKVFRFYYETITKMYEKTWLF